MNRGLFLDRDGVICQERNLFYGGTPVTRAEDLEFFPRTEEAFQRMARLDFKLVIVTNQSAIGRGELSREEFERMNEKINQMLGKYGRRFDGIYVCPHVPEENCDCRKPKTGMLLRAERELEIRLRDSIVIGDKTSDIKMGIDAGCRTGLVKTGYGGRDKLCKVEPDFISDDLYSALTEIGK